MNIFYYFTNFSKLKLLNLLIISLFLVSFSASSQITYVGNGNTGHNGMVGESTLQLSNDATRIYGTFTKGSGDYNRVLVIYFSTGASGRSVIDGTVNDQNDNLRKAISSAGTSASDITFPAGFEATHAIAIARPFGGLWSIPDTGPIGDGGLVYLGPVGSPGTATNPSFTFDIQWSELGLTSSDSFEFVATLIRPTNGFLFNEGYGIGLPSSNPGASNVTFTSAKRYPFFYSYDGTTWSPSNPNGVNENERDVVIESGSVTFTSNTVLRDISVNTGAELIIEPSVVLDLDGNIASEGTITFESDGSNSAQLGEMVGNSGGGGDFVVERFIPAGDNNRRVFRFLSSPVNSTGSIRENWQEDATSNTDNPNPGFGTHITGTTTDGTNGFDGSQTGNASLLLFDNSTQTWGAIDNTDVNTVVAGNAYNIFVRGDRSIDLASDPADAPNNTTLRTTGSLVSGDVDFTPELATGDGEWSLLGNPYQSIVDFNALNFSGDINSNIIYVWRPNSGTAGTYEAIDNATPAEQMIQPGQSFFVQNSADVTTPPELEFTESAKNTTGLVTDVFSSGNIGIVDLSLYSNDIKLDVLKLRFEAGANNKIDDYDFGKLSNPSENLASLNNNTLLSIERRDYPNGNDILPLFVDQYQNSQYEFRLNTTNFDNDINIYLVDKYLNTETLIEQGQPYSFDIDSNIPESTATDRFSISFENTTLSIDDNTFANGFSLYPNPTNDGLFTIKTNGLDSSSVNVNIHNLMGQEVLNQKYDVQSNGEIKINAENLKSGVYFIAVNQNNNSFTTKLIIQ